MDINDKNFFKKFISLWDIIIICTVFISVFMIFFYYFEISPDEIARIERIHKIITILFVLDVILRAIIFKSDYLKSSDIVIDIISCIDILGPILKPLKLLRLARMIRVVRLFRILKLMRFFEFHPQTVKLFNIVGFISLILFIFLGNFLTNLMKSDYVHLMRKNYEIVLQNAVDNFSVENKLTNIYGFVDDIAKLKNLLKVDIKLAKGDYTYYCIPKEKIEKDYNLENDTIKVTYKFASLTLVTKQADFIASKAGYYALLTGVLFYFILFIAIYFYSKDKTDNL